MSSTTTNHHSSIRSFFSSTSRWLEKYSRSSLSAAEALAMRDAILQQQWEQASGENKRTGVRTR